MGADITVTGLNVILAPSPPHPLTLSPLSLTVPGDISSAAFLLVAGLLVPGSEVGIEGVGVNETRTGLLDVLAGMAADVALDDRREQGGEPVADLTARASALRGTTIAGEMVVRMIDEFPVLAVAATQAEGETVVREAEELRVKETDRIAVIASELRKMGARIEPQPDGFVVEGPTRLQGAVVDSHGDHRIAMALTVAGLIAQGQTTIKNTACIADSFPGFEDVLQDLTSP
jgi:3-phosphoshikimate 1-carboxyvinyltransferase